MPELDGSGVFTWDVTGMAAGDYYIYAKIDDQLNLPRYTYSETTVTIPPPGLGGRIFRDYNGNGMWDDGEPPVTGHAVFLDLDDDGMRDENEPIATSTADDPATPDSEAGRYRFTDLEPGEYVVRQVLAQGLVQTMPSADTGHHVSVHLGSIVSGHDFGHHSTHQNPLNRFDVTDNGLVSPLDALYVIDWLNSQSSGSLPGNAPPYRDTSGDGLISPVDVLLVIDRLNRGEAEGENTGKKTQQTALPLLDFLPGTPAPAHLIESSLPHDSTQCAIRQVDAGEWQASVRVGFPASISPVPRERWDELDAPSSSSNLAGTLDDLARELTRPWLLDEDLWGLLSRE